MHKHFAILLVVSIFAAKDSKEPDFKQYELFSLNLYVGQFEVKNGEYNQFLAEFSKGKTAAELAEYKIDSSKWSSFSEHHYGDPMKLHYHSHPAYANFPVVNISRKAAIAYCDWLSEKYNSQKKREFEEVRFRLPSSEEWMSFAKPLLNNRLPWYGSLPYIPKEDGSVSDIICNIKHYNFGTGKHNYLADGGFYPVKVGSYPANLSGLYDIIGNVAEMTSDSLVKGGSWDNTIEESFIDLEQDYQVPDPRVGFRVVMEVL